jgi:hypothetical protein
MSEVSLLPQVRPRSALLPDGLAVRCRVKSQEQGMNRNRLSFAAAVLSLSLAIGLGNTRAAEGEAELPVAVDSFETASTKMLHGVDILAEARAKPLPEPDSRT